MAQRGLQLTIKAYHGNVAAYGNVCPQHGKQWRGAALTWPIGMACDSSNVCMCV